jgi:hypothetical protein
MLAQKSPHNTSSHQYISQTGCHPVPSYYALLLSVKRYLSNAQVSFGQEVRPITSITFHCSMGQNQVVQLHLTAREFPRRKIK